MSRPTGGLTIDKSTIHLLSRASSDHTPSTPRQYSDYGDDIETYYIKTRPHSRTIRFRQFLQSLTHTPLGWGSKRKTKSKRLRLFSCCVNLVVILFIGVSIISLAQAIFHPSYSNPPAHYRQLEETIRASDHPGRGNPRGEKIFIASNIIQHDMIRGSWGASLLHLIDLLGPGNVFVSIYENDSGSETISALSWLRDQMKGPYSISFGDHLPLSEFPAIVAPDGHARVKRITYLSQVRNRLLTPLGEPRPLPQNNQEYPDEQISSTASFNYTDTRFDRILFINDIYFSPIDALHLLFSTNQNPETGIAEYQAACGIDFNRGGALYDSFVIRDTDGFEISWFLYPWFTKRGSATTRNAVLAQSDAVPVRSCWSGIAAYDSTQFLRQQVLDANSKVADPTLTSASSIDSADVTTSRSIRAQNSSPLRFRHQSDAFWEASECCLINADLSDRYTLTQAQIFINPYVRVAYEPTTWALQPFVQRLERGFSLMQSLADKLCIGCEDNPRRNQIVGRSAPVTKWLYDDPSLNGEILRNATFNADHPHFPLSASQLRGSWHTVDAIAEPGGFCGQRRLFVMMDTFAKANRENTGKNWFRVPLPPP